jgi:hypothetical protein
MGFRPSEVDQNALDAFLETILDAYEEGTVERRSAVGLIAHAMTAAAIDNKGEFEKFIRLPKESIAEY